MPSADFRISTPMLVRNSMSNLQTSMAKLADLQEEAASLKRLRKPSDAPADVVSAMQLHSDLNRNTQIQRNLDDAMAWLGSADNALTSGIDQLERVRELALLAKNASSDAVARQGIATEIEQIRQSLLGVANTQFAGRPVFGGTVSGGAAYQANGTYVGTSVAIERTIAPGQRVQINVNGDDVFGTPGNDLFTTLAQIANAAASDTSQLETLTAALDTRVQAMQTQLTEVGARFRRVETMQSQNSSDALTMKKNLSGVEDADLAEVMMNLQTQQVAYQAALAATARAIQPSLVDFLR